MRSSTAWRRHSEKFFIPHSLMTKSSINLQVTHRRAGPIESDRGINGLGHPNITATHPTTLEITKESSLTKKGDCVVAVGATKGLKDFSKEFRRICINDNSRIILQLCASGMVERVVGRGNRLLTLSDSEELVIRRSTCITDRTLMVEADKAAADFSRRLVRELRSSSTRIHLKLTAEVLTGRLHPNTLRLYRGQLPL